MDLQKAIDQISNKGESVEVTVGSPGNVAEAAPAPEAAPVNVGVGSMDDSVSASIDQAISNVGMSPENTVGSPGAMAVPSPVETATMPVAGVAETGGSVGNSALEVSATMPETNADIESVRKEAIEALLPVLGQADLDASEKFEIYKEAAAGGNKDQAVISGMVTAAKEISNEKEKAEALLSAIRIIDGK